MNVLPKKGGHLMTIETNITNRRELAGALAQYMNTRAVYLGPPTFAYQIGDTFPHKRKSFSLF